MFGSRKGNLVVAGWVRRSFRAFFAMTFVLTSVAPLHAVESQKPSALFTDGRMPVALSVMSNQLNDAPEPARITERVLADQQNPNLVKVAVVGTGVDIFHPDLVNQIDFEVREGRIVGAGRDFVGEDRFGSPSEVSATLFAFGAERIVNGRIHRPHQDPIQLVALYNDIFMRGLVAHVAATPALQGTVFAKINTRSMTLYGLHQLLATSPFSAQAYEAMGQAGVLIEPTDRPSSPRLRLSPQRVFAHAANVQQWVAGPHTGMPDTALGELSSELWSLRGADVFSEVIARTLNEFMGMRMGGTPVYDHIRGVPYTVRDVVGSLPTYQQAFTNLRLYLGERGEMAPVANALRTLTDALEFAHHGASRSNGFEDAKRGLTRQIIQRRVSTGMSVPADFVPSVQELREEIERTRATVAEFIRFSRENSESVAERVDMRELESRMGALRQMQEWVLNDRINGDSPEIARRYDRIRMNTRHPYISPNGLNASHETQVAGIIAHGNPNVRIVPIRVTLGEARYPETKRNEIALRFRQSFAAWLREPVVARAMAAQFRETLPEARSFQDTTIGRQRLAAKLMRVWSESIANTSEQNTQLLSAFEEIREAVRYIGERGIPYANMSLGMNYNMSSAPPSGEQASRPERVFEFMKVEFLKYDIARAIHTYASRTTFVIAAGNDGAWLDSRSRSGLPVDLSSSFLGPHERPGRGTAELAPNNHLKNILGVISLTPENHLSAFTNLPISSRVPFIAARGEAILAPIRTTDFTGTRQNAFTVLPELSTLFAIGASVSPEAGAAGNPRAEPFITSRLRETSPNLRAAEELMARSALAESFKISTTLLNAGMAHMGVKYVDNRARANGTSFSAPVVMNDILQHHERLRDATPQAVIEATLARGRRVSSRRAVFAYDRLNYTREIAPSASARATERLLRSFRTRGDGQSFSTRSFEAGLPALMPRQLPVVQGQRLPVHVRTCDMVFGSWR